MHVKPVTFVDSMEELEIIAEHCDFAYCNHCSYCDICIDRMGMWAYEENIASTPESLYRKINEGE